MEITLLEKAKLAQAFDTWNARYIADPSGFSMPDECGSYGASCADYLLEILAEQEKDGEANGTV